MAERDFLDAASTSTLGQYRVRGRIGSGGMGDVYDAVHVTLDKRVAIKTLRRRFLEDEIVVARFLREGQLASRMRHPNIVDITDVGVIDGLPCLVMEHLEGETLGQVIRRDGALPVGALVDILLPIVAAVDFAHDHGVLHRDLKPSNIFLARSWNGEVYPKVLDFGISKLVHESTEAALTTDSAFVGTPQYASPESVRAEKAADRRSDQYSMGVILYEGSTGVRPFADRGGSFVTIALAIVNGDYASPRTHNPALPEALERVIQRAMSLQADDRFLGMRELGAALLPFASDRARVIWSPAFGSDPSGVRPPSPDTKVLLPGVTTRRPSLVPTTKTRAEPRPYLTGAPTRVAPHDPTPSFGAGVNRSIPPSPRQAKRSPFAFVGVAVVVLVGSGMIGILLSRVSAGRTSAAGAEASASSATSTFVVDVRTNPVSAALELDGNTVGTGRLSKLFARDGQKHVLRVSAPGYEALLVPFDEALPPPSLVSLRASTQTPAIPGAGVPAETSVLVTPPPRNAAPAQALPNARPAPNPKGKPTDRPRTDNINPWE